MPVNDLGLPERAALLALMAAGREISNPDLERLAGRRLDGESRRKLNQRGLVSSRKDGRALVHELTDQGWRWCADELTADCPPRAGSAGGTLYAVLGGLHRFLARSDLRLADVFGPDGGPPAAQPAPAAAPPGAAGVDLTEQVRAAYRKLAREPREWVGLAQLRPLLGDAARDDVDAALRQLARTPQVNVVPQANQKVLSPAEREAALRIGAEDCHLISIEDS